MTGMEKALTAALGLLLERAKEMDQFVHLARQTTQAIMNREDPDWEAPPYEEDLTITLADIVHRAAVVSAKEEEA